MSRWRLGTWVALVAAVVLLVGVGVGIGALVWSGDENEPTTAAETRPPPPLTLTLPLSSAVQHCISDGARRGLVVTSLGTGTHARGSYHYVGRAADQAGSRYNMLRLQRHLYKTRRKWLEVFGPSGYMSVKNGQPLHLDENSALARLHDGANAHVHCAG